MAELRPYEPTWRDRIAQMMMGDGRASPERRRFVEGLLGSSGLGNTGMGVVDVTPVGGLLQAQEAVQEGDPRGAALAVLPIPGAAKVKQAANVAADVATPQGIRAYHGSPHDFDRFDLSKIGTGEGAQAYGHGLYFADNENIAKWYREQLTRGAGNWMVDGTPAGMLHSSTNPLDAMKFKVALEVRNGRPVDEAIDFVMKQEQSRLTSKRTFPEDMPVIQENLSLLNAMKSSPPEIKRGGRMYEVNIRANPEDFLDWDKPLSEQPEAVRRLAGWTPETEAQYWSALKQDSDALFAALEGNADYKATRLPRPQGAAPMDWTGAQFYESSKLVPGNYRDKVAATERLREAGIPGIKYLDAGSRAAGEGSRNYVVFDENLIDILRKYGLVPGMIGGGAAANSFGLLGPEGSSEY